MKCYKDLDLNKLMEVSGIDYIYFQKKPDVVFNDKTTYAFFKNNGVNILDNIKPEDNFRDVFVLWECDFDKMHKLCAELKNQLGDRYRIIIPTNMHSSIEIDFLGDY